MNCQYIAWNETTTIGLQIFIFTSPEDNYGVGTYILYITMICIYYLIYEMYVHLIVRNVGHWCRRKYSDYNPDC